MTTRLAGNREREPPGIPLRRLPKILNRSTWPRCLSLAAGLFFPAGLPDTLRRHRRRRSHRTKFFGRTERAANRRDHLHELCRWSRQAKVRSDLCKLGTFVQFGRTFESGQGARRKAAVSHPFHPFTRARRCGRGRGAAGRAAPGRAASTGFQPYQGRNLPFPSAISAAARCRKERSSAAQDDHRRDV